MAFSGLKTSILLSFFSVTTIATEYVKPTDSWQYYDRTKPLPHSWHLPSFDASKWPTGSAPLGYGENDEHSLIKRHGQKTPHYFRKQFEVIDLATIEQLHLSFLIDDGAIFYLNGKEVFRANLPDELSTESLAIDTFIEHVWLSKVIDKSLLKQGANTLAVAVYQISENSSDLSFAASLNSDTAK